METDRGAPRSIGICVDDFGLHGAVNEAVLALAAARRISAVSCLVDGEAWAQGAAALRGAGGQALEVGLHLNLTERLAGTRVCFEWSTLVLRAYAGLLGREALRAEIRAQLDRFEQAMGRAPDFVDGHRHVHQLPVVRGALVAELAQRYPQRRPWLRATYPAASRAPGDTAVDAVKPWVIAALGARGLAGLCRHVGLPQNGRLLGSYNFSGSADDYLARLRSWLRAARGGDLLMCHPATGLVPGDAIAAARVVEYGVLAGAAVGRMLGEEGISVERLSPHLAA